MLASPGFFFKEANLYSVEFWDFNLASISQWAMWLNGCRAHKCGSNSWIYEDLHVMEDFKMSFRKWNVSENVFGLIGH